ncbi:MAG: GNAT family N-acetyltransferase [Lachnospiraceae bacterium]|nr:GNAT family N-acetyltransferase [Lachnospiraceae bacterium]
MQHTCETDRLILKTLGKEAAPMVLSFYEENKSHFEPWEPKRPNNFYTLFYQKASLSAEYHQMAEGKLLRYWVFHKDNTDEIIGTVCFQNFLRAPYLSCSLGYKYGYKYIHKGYAYESIQKGIRLVWDEYNMHRIEAYIMPSNKPSLRLIKRLDFVYEGLCYSYACINDQWSDHKRYALINPADELYRITP